VAVGSRFSHPNRTLKLHARPSCISGLRFYNFKLGTYP
jgi:hypothetical protein